MQATVIHAKQTYFDPTLHFWSELLNVAAKDRKHIEIRNQLVVMWNLTWRMHNYTYDSLHQLYYHYKNGDLTFKQKSQQAIITFSFKSLNSSTEINMNVEWMPLAPLLGPLINLLEIWKCI